MVRLALAAVNWISSSTYPSGPTAALGPVRSMLAVWPSQVGWKLGVVRSRRDSRRSAHGTNRRLLECFTVPAPGSTRVPASRAGLRRRHRRQVKDRSSRYYATRGDERASKCQPVVDFVQVTAQSSPHELQGPIMHFRTLPSVAASSRGVGEPGTGAEVVQDQPFTGTGQVCGRGK